jgi:hypothetical protein
LRLPFKQHFLAGFQGAAVVLTPPPEQVPHSSLVHMFESVCGGFSGMIFTGKVATEGAWSVDVLATLTALRQYAALGAPVAVLGTAFSFVMLLDAMTEAKQRLVLPPGSRVFETGGYKGRSRSMSRADLHKFITRSLGVPGTFILCEYGMSELSSQAYDTVVGASVQRRIFQFPPWVRARVISAETGAEVDEGEAGLMQIVDLANAASVMALQTEDLAVRRDGGFELLGRTTQSEPRGCSLMSMI